MGDERLCDHSFTVQSAEHEMKTPEWNGFHRMVYTAMWGPSYVSRYWPEYALEHLWILPSSVPTMNRCSCTELKSKQQPPARPDRLVSSGSSFTALTSLSCIPM